MVDKSIFFVRPDLFQKIPNEVVLGTYKSIEMWEKKENFKLDGLDLQITSHRLLVTSSQNKQLGFCINLENVIEQKDIKEGLVFKKLVAFKVKYQNQTKIEFKISKGLEDSLVQIKGALAKKLWTKKVEIQNPNNPPQPVLYGGLKDIEKREAQRQLEHKQVMQSSFEKGDIQSLFQNARELKELSVYLKTNMQNSGSKPNSELDSILNGLGYFSLITKEDSGKNYIDDISRQIYQMCTELFPKIGGIITLLDVYYFINKKRQMSLLSPLEVLQACQRFQPLGLHAIVQSYGNIKYIEPTSYDSERDFNENIGKYLPSYEQGITPEELSKKLRIPPLICRIKLNKALSAGKLVLDDGIEGQTYYKNIILDFN